MDQRVLRLWAASEALGLGWGGIAAVAEATGLSQTSIRAGIAECRTPRTDPEAFDHQRLRMGKAVHPRSTDLLVTADGRGSNGSRSRLWKLALQGVADETGLRITVCHFPPGTSKWNKIEHRMFRQITENWRGRPLVSRSFVVNLIGNTRTRAGLRIKAELDTDSDPTGVKFTDEGLATVRIEEAKFHGEWNDTISPT